MQKMKTLPPFTPVLKEPLQVRLLKKPVPTFKRKPNISFYTTQLTPFVSGNADVNLSDPTSRFLVGFECKGFEDYFRFWTGRDYGIYEAIGCMVGEVHLIAELEDREIYCIWKYADCGAVFGKLHHDGNYEIVRNHIDRFLENPEIG